MNTNGSEKSDTQKFWLALIRDTFGIDKPEDYIVFEKKVEIEHTKFIDAFIPSTGIIIEQKSKGINLDSAFVQAKNYYDWLPFSQRGRYIITCDFNEIHVHDMEAPTKKPDIIPVSSATKNNLSFLVIPGKTLPRETDISIEAGRLVGKLYNSLLASLHKVYRESERSTDEYKNALNDVNIFCVRLVFLLYAEDSGLFNKSQFHDYLKPRSIMARDALAKLFSVLNTDKDKREQDLEDELKAFHYVNGGLFEKNIKLPRIDDETLKIIIENMSEKFNWSGISPTIFGAIFESTINPETRYQEGMHYTAPETIHKVIGPLFLDGLDETLKKILLLPPSFERTQKLLALQKKLASLKFLDPACGSGNFLTESFISLRRLENRIIKALPENERLSAKVSVSIDQFHGIEVHDFAVNVAKTALWISDHQMWKETQNITHSHEVPLPLKDYDGIEEGDALKSNLLITGWNIPHDDMLYIMGNPPFMGYSQQNKPQKESVKNFFGKAKSDYVSCWFAVASEYLQDKNTKAAFIATNSITQGEQVAYVFKPLREKWGIKIDFARQSFVWNSESKDKAQVHVVVIGFSTNPPELKSLYSPDGAVKLVQNINFYLAEGPDEDIAVPRNIPICSDAPAMNAGGKPAEGGNLIMTEDEMHELVQANPLAEKFIRPFMGANDFTQRKPRYCLWLVNVKPDDIMKCPKVRARVESVRAFRQSSKKPATKKKANTPTMFDEVIENRTTYIAIPKTSSEKREYIPIDWLTPNVIAGDSLMVIPDATLYHFGVLASRVHMAWMRRVCGRMKSDYRYSATVVYNTFAWPSPSPEQRTKIEQTAQEILNARAMYPNDSFAALYDDTLMPSELRRAHERNDRAVCSAYGWAGNISDDEIAAGLFRLYHRLAAK